MGWTKRQYVTQAFEEIGLASYVFDLTPVVQQPAIAHDASPGPGNRPRGVDQPKLVLSVGQVATEPGTVFVEPMQRQLHVQDGIGGRLAPCHGPAVRFPNLVGEPLGREASQEYGGE